MEGCAYLEHTLSLKHRLNLGSYRHVIGHEAGLNSSSYKLSARFRLASGFVISPALCRLHSKRLPSNAPRIYLLSEFALYLLDRITTAWAQVWRLFLLVHMIIDSVWWCFKMYLNEKRWWQSHSWATTSKMLSNLHYLESFFTGSPSSMAQSTNLIAW